MSKTAPAQTQSDRFCGGPKLNAVVFDRAPVCEVAAEFAEQFNVPDRVSTVAGDTWGEEPSLETDSSGRRDSSIPAAEGRAGPGRPMAARFGVHYMVFCFVKHRPNRNSMCKERSVAGMFDAEFFEDQLWP